ncbi:hypothetical protein PIB30_109826, partial [Stylosanthes scabra]|nr:hypothetical protein [Stylosanthes scabra]
MVINVFEAMQHPEDEETEECMRTDIIEMLVKEIQEDNMLKESKAYYEETFATLSDTNFEFLVQENEEKKLQKIEENKEEKDEEKKEVTMQKNEEENQKNKGEVQQKTKYATLKGRPSRMLNHLPTILKYAFLRNIKNLTCQCKMLVDLSHMLNTMKHEVRKLWDPG